MGALKLIGRFFASESGVCVLVGMLIASVMLLWPAIQRVPSAWFGYFWETLFGAVLLFVLARWWRQVRRDPAAVIETVRTRPLLAFLKFAQLALLIGWLCLPIWYGFGEPDKGRQSREGIALLLVPLLNLAIIGLVSRNSRATKPT
jgi:hypothetical protein